MASETFYRILLRRSFELLLLVFTLSETCLSQSLTLSYSRVPIKIGWLKGQQVNVNLDFQEIGYICYVKIPATRWYVIFDFYIPKNFEIRVMVKNFYLRFYQKLFLKGQQKYLYNRDLLT